MAISVSLMFLLVALATADEYRVRRSPDGDQPWALNPNVVRDADGNVVTTINVKRDGQQHDFEAGWAKVVRGPDRAKPTWHVGGTFRWRRSAEENDFIEDIEESRVKRSPKEEKKPWEFNPNVGRDENGNVRTDINVKRNGENSDVEAGWSKVVHGPGKAKPTWHVGGTIRWRRSADESEFDENNEEPSEFDEQNEDSRVKRSPKEEKKPWEFNPNVGRDENGNVRTDINVKRNGENSDVEAGWSKVVHGPGKAKPTWHVGGTIRWRRSADDNGFYEENETRAKRSPKEEKKPWEFNPNVGRDENGNVRTDINVKRNGENSDVEAGWSKVVHGPGKAKPIWRVGGTIRW